LTLVAVAGSISPADELKPAGKASFQPGEAISDQGSLTFSKDGDRLYFNVAPPRPKAEPAAKEKEEKAAVELWHYQDGFIVPMQKVRYDRDQQASHRAVFRLTDRTCRQLVDDRLSEVFPAPAGDLDLGMDDRPYRLLVGREAGAAADYYLINTRDGSQKPIVKKQTSPVTWSQGGKYLLFFSGKHWHSFSVATGQVVNLTAGLKVPFFHEHHDQPGPAPSYGVAGWTAGDQQVLLYDRYDIWSLSPDGKGGRNLTGGLGRKSTTALRIVSLTPRPAALDPAKPLLVRAHNETTEDTGFYRVPLDGGSPRLLIMGARNYSTPVKARRSDTLSLTVSTFYDCPEVYITDLEFHELRKQTNQAAQKNAFVWGKSELVHYRSADGVPLQGVLIKPENFQPGKKYPMIVYIYERLSDRLHVFVEPRPGTSINPSYYASNGYLVLMPDIAYTVGYPGQSALKCVLPAIQAVVDQGCVQENAIGIQGHSWGGYQTAYLITQTTRFKAAAAGAPVVNMTSAYGGIRWGTGLSRQFQYEHTQSRIGGTLWQYPTRFLENSPLFQADRIKTPLLMLHNDKDEAVPWQQGIEYYLALRRLGKEVYLCNYPGEGHGLRRRVNMADYTMRMQQFFDHHLKGAPKPAWMAKGIPFSPPPAERTSPRPTEPETE
jgi:dipeptidyl aminopeptidase/acylaminoacyl peptidase